MAASSWSRSRCRSRSWSPDAPYVVRVTAHDLVQHVPAAPTRGRHAPARSALDRAQRFRSVPTLGGVAHHPEEAAQGLVVGMDLDVVAEGGRGVVESAGDLAELRA